MSNIPIGNNYYPAISDLITVNDLPEILGFLQTEIQQIFSNLYYMNYQSSKTIGGIGTFYSLDVVSLQKLQVELPGTGIYLVLNPDFTNTAISSFPITVFWQWEILKYVSYFNVTGFSFSVEDLFNLALEIFDVTEEQAIVTALNIFVTPTDPSISRLDQLINDINTLYSSSIVIDENSADPYQDLITQIDALNEEVFPTIFSLYLAEDTTSATAKLNDFFSIFVPSDIKDYVESIVIPKARATLELTAALEFPRSMLLPMVKTSTGFTPDMSLDSSGNLKTTYIQFGDAILDIDTSTGFGFQTDFSGTLFPTYAQIANTCLVISFTDVKLDLSRTTNIPEATAAGYPVDFVGAYVKSASITLNGLGTQDTTKESVTLAVKNFLIGTGGVSGTVTLSDTGVLYRNFGNFSAGLDSFSVTFKQNTIVSCDIKGKLVLPSGFSTGGGPSTILIDVNIKDAGDFSATATVQGAFPTFNLLNIFTLTIRSLSLGEKNGRFFISVAGTLDFNDTIPGLPADVLPRGVIIKKLTIWDNGQLEFEGGGFTIPRAFKFPIGPVKLEVSHLSFGTYSRMFNNVERAYYYFGFDGMVNAGTAGIAVGGNGIKYYFTHDDGPGMPHDSFISIAGIAIDLSIPALNPTFILDGYLSMKNPTTASSNAATQYTGKVTVKLPSLGMTGSAAMALTPSIPAFVVDLGLELSTPIPLGATSLGIYGFRGLIGQHYIPSKTKAGLQDTATWWDYYKANPVGIQIDKFDDQSGFSLGAGISIATEFDSGFIFSSKLFLLLGLPDVFLIQGQANIISKRLGLNDTTDPPFSALIVFSSQSILGNLSVNLNLPNNGLFKGKLFSLQAALDMAFYFNNASGWYLNLGTMDKPVKASILSLFQGTAFVMMSSQGIKAGAGISFNFNKSLGFAQLSLGATLSLGGSISFSPLQIGAFLQVSGYAYVKIWKVKLGIAVSLAMAVEAPNPLNINGSITVKVKIIFATVKATFDISWHGDNADGIKLLEVPNPVLALPGSTAGYTPVIATNILTNETFPVNYVNSESATGSIPPPHDSSWMYDFTILAQAENVIIPVDSFIDIELLKPVIPGNVPIGGAANQLPDFYKELIPPQKGPSAQVTHQYELTGLGIYSWSGTAWEPYNIYEAVTAIVDANNAAGTAAIDLTQLKQGYWQFTDKDKFNKIRLLSQNMFSFGNGSTTTTSDLAGRKFSPGDLFCYDKIAVAATVNWKGLTAGVVYPENLPVLYDALSFTFTGVSGSVAQETSFGNTALLIQGTVGQITIDFPEPVAHIELDFGDNQQVVTVSFNRTSYVVNDFGLAIGSQNVVSSLPLTPGTPVIYDSNTVAIDRVVLVFTDSSTPDYNGNLIIGGHYPLPAQYLNPSVPALNGSTEMDKTLMFATLYNQAFTAAQVLTTEYLGQAGVAAQWTLETTTASTGGLLGLTSGSMDKVPGFYEVNTLQALEVLHNVYSFTAISDSLAVPYVPALKIENGSFAFEITALFNPFAAGTGTLISKVFTDATTGLKKGFTLHLIQNSPAVAGTSYTTIGAIPQFKVLFTSYSGTTFTAIEASAEYTIDCLTSGAIAAQYKRILVSVDRTGGNVTVYIDRILRATAAIPTELSVFVANAPNTYLNQLSYVTEGDQARLADNPATSPDGLVSEVQVLNNTINKTVQPVWRPNTTFAIKIDTQDRVNGSIPSGSAQTHIFGFQTAGPLGHFHQYSPVYQALEATDQADAFKLANLQFYIDVNRSFPDAQGRYNLSKPVLVGNAQVPPQNVQLYFTEPYVNAMYSTWAAYNGLPAVNSSLQVQLIDPSGSIISPTLVQTAAQTITIDSSNYTTLPPDQQILFWFYEAALHSGCSPLPAPLVKTLTQYAYEFPPLQPHALYTALFNAVYQPDGSTADSVEVYKFSFLTSLFDTFQDQANSFILSTTPGPGQYAIYPKGVSFSQDYISQTLKFLIDSDPSNDPASVTQYALPYERLIYGGLQLPAPEPFTNTAINLIINTDPTTQTKVILGILVYNPEPFNDPKLPAASLANTVQLTLVLPDNTTMAPGQFITIYSGDTSAVFITNTAMNIPLGNMQIYFRYKQYNGVDYETVFQDYTSPSINIANYF